MKTVRWKKLLRLNKKMMDYKIRKLKEVTDMETHVITGRYSIDSASVEVYAEPSAPIERRWQKWRDEVL